MSSFNYAGFFATWHKADQEYSQEKDAFLHRVLEEIDGFDGALTGQSFHDIIMKRNGMCKYTVDELEEWLNEEEPEQSGVPFGKPDWWHSPTGREWQD